MTLPDQQICARHLRAMADAIVAAWSPELGTLDLPVMVERIRKIGGDALVGLKAELDALYPAVGWMDEDGVEPEGGADASQAEFWLCDPIDGAYHYVQGMPLWSTSLALIRGGEAVFAVVHDPSLGETFIAQKDQGATVNGRPLRPSAKSRLDAAVLGTAIAPILQVGPQVQQRALAALGAMSPQVFAVRQLASSSLQLAYVAAGRLDGHWEIGSDVPDWLGGALLVREAGGRVTDVSGQPFDWTSGGILAATPGLHGAVQTVLAKVF